jgi:hypothetical protein
MGNAALLAESVGVLLAEPEPGTPALAGVVHVPREVAEADLAASGIFDPEDADRERREAALRHWVMDVCQTHYLLCSYENSTRSYMFRRADPDLF